MYRDLKLVKKVLGWLEENSPSTGSRRDELREGLFITVSDSASLDYHLDLLTGGGFVSREPSLAGSDCFKLTWHGHDLLDRLVGES
ncbi:DUF2513 domain-containing protein [Pseudomonas monteilii]|uniref:DUF2513 domain-containing protein n=1 Tax=Pseudomonas monteilii TaxID=76759 RepID=UPI00118271AC|nr:DUF2513 domain-containing protein [Pseudomonas monteilii]